jgi:dipeptidyl aminopeptidase/acylaminoacyl peptidase
MAHLVSGERLLLFIMAAPMRLFLCSLSLLCSSLVLPAQQTAQQKPRIAFDEFFNSVGIDSLDLSPDGNSVLVSTTRPDWPGKRWRKDIWLAKPGEPQRLLTQTGHESSPRWSPDGRWIAFLSDRKVEALPDECPREIVNSPKEEECEPSKPERPKTPKSETEKPSPEKPKALSGRDAEDDAEDENDKEVAQLYVMSVAGGEPIVITAGREEVHAYAWSPDSSTLYVARRITWTPKQREEHKKRWKSVSRFREDDRPDEVIAFKVAEAIARSQGIPPASTKQTSVIPAETPSTAITKSQKAIRELQPSPDGDTLAFVTAAIHSRVEDPTDYEIFLVPSAGGDARQLTKNTALEDHIRWTADGKRIFFSTGLGSIEGPYADAQTRIYSVGVDSGTTARYAQQFTGAVSSPEVASNGSLLALGRAGTVVGIYSQQNPQADFTRQTGVRGTFETFSVSEKSPRIAAVFSSAERAPEVYLAENAAALANAKPITNFNQIFSQRALPELRTFQWKSNDGTPVEGVLLYPPGQADRKKLRTFVLIHGGPADADGDSFGADWYNFAVLAATEGWLVFRPNYRGSSGYGDKFQLDIAPNLVSTPGRDILSGVDALVQQGIADPDRLAIGGYSYGGYMTNWLITQTTRFKASVTGAGAVEHLANWGNDDLTHDDAWYLGGLPWEQKQRYNDEAAIWQIDKVKTPTHMVVGGDDIRVAALESYLLERALHKLNIPSTLLIFPGEGHSLRKNPWHGYIKVREELDWLDKYIPDSKKDAKNTP